MRKILVTGASGFVGSALVRRLQHDARDVVLGLHRANADVSAAPHVVLGDLADGSDRRPMLEGMDCVVHTAARVHVMDETSSDPLEAFRAMNVRATLALARQAIDVGVKRFVFLSSIKVNGEETREGQPFTAAQPPAPQDAYGISKLEAETELLELARDTGLEVVIVRPPLVYGPGVKANFRALMRLLTFKLPLPFGAIHNSRSMVNVQNLADLLLACIDNPAAVNRVFLASDGEDLSTTDLLRRLGRALGVRARLIPVPAKWLMGVGALAGHAERIRRLCGNLQIDATDTRYQLGWSPPESVDDGLLAAARHFRNETSV